MPLLYALWPYHNGRPHPDARDPWGETRAAVCLTDYKPEDCGSFLTVVHTEDGDTCRPVFSGDVSAVFLAYAAQVAQDTGHPAFTGPAIDRARHAFEVAVEHDAQEWAREACIDWMCPDPDTLRSLRRMPERTRAGIATSARQDAAAHEGERLDRFLCDALRIDAETGTVRHAAAA